MDKERAEKSSQGKTDILLTHRSGHGPAKTATPQSKATATTISSFLYNYYY